MEQENEFTNEPQMAEYFVQNATRFVCLLECMPMLLIATIILKSRMNPGGSRTVLRGAGGESPLAYSTVCSLYNLTNVKIDWANLAGAS